MQIVGPKDFFQYQTPLDLYFGWIDIQVLNSSYS